MNSKRSYALIVAEKGEQAEGLKALTETIPLLAHVYQVGDIQSALRLIYDLCPDLLLVNIELPISELETLVNITRSICSRTRYIVLANDASQQDEIRSIGADVVELVGIPAAKLAAIIQGQLVGKEGTYTA